MLKEMKLQWKKTKLSELGDNEDTWFYAFTRGNVLLYIGITYHQVVHNEIKKRLRELSINSSGLSIWLGYIAESDYERITKQIVRDIECLLIYAHQPSYNTQCTSNYTGRDNLKVKNKGCPMLKSCVKVEEGEIYSRCR